MNIPKLIPEEYQINPDRCRRLSPFESSIHLMKLEELKCPRCGCTSLRIMDYSRNCIEDEYIVGCDECDWVCPAGTISDYGESVSVFKEWLAAYHLIGEPEAYLNQDCTKYFDPENNHHILAHIHLLELNDDAVVKRIEEMINENISDTNKDKICDMLNRKINEIKGGNVV